MTALILTIVLTMGISFFCSILEACLLSLSSTDIAKISERKPHIGQIWSLFKANIQKPIAVILIVNTLAHTIGASLSGAQFDECFGPKWIGLYSLAFSLAMIQWTEILPKTLGVRYNILIAERFAVPLKMFIAIFSPFVYLVQLINRPFGGTEESKKEMDELNDMRYLARFAFLNKKITENQATILHQTIQLGEKRISEIMVKKDDMKWLSTRMSLADALIESHKHHHTRFPLIEEHDINNIVGYVNFKDIISALKTNPTDPSLRGICRPVLTFHESDSLSSLIHQLMKSYQHIAIVRDAQGRVAGMVTLENVLEAIVGDIHDEYDILPEYAYPITTDRILASGGISINALRDHYQLDLPASEKKVDAWLHELMPRHTFTTEEVIPYKSYRFIIRKISRSQIFEVIIETEKLQGEQQP